MAEKCKPMVVENKNLYGLNCKLLGRIKLTAPDFLAKCDDKKAMDQITREACQIKSNLINITAKAVIRNTNCNSFVADLS